MTNDLTHRSIEIPDGQLHAVSAGEGPLTLLVHGFPETWTSWRHQLPALAAAGYQAVALDVRGYGQSFSPDAVEAYRMMVLVGDMLAVTRAYGANTATVIGHDWGSPIAAACGLLRPDVFTAIGMLSVPYTPPGGPRPTTIFEQIGGSEDYYVSYFQRPGQAESEIDPDVRGWLRGFYLALAGETDPPAWESGVFTIPAGARMRDRFPTGELPSWLTGADLDIAAASFTRSGLAGPLNRYRNMDRDWEDLAAFEAKPLTQPSIYIAGDRDASTVWLADAIKAYPNTLPELSGAHLLDGAGHWIQQERPDEVNELLVNWLRGLT